MLIVPTPQRSAAYHDLGLEGRKHEFHLQLSQLFYTGSRSYVFLWAAFQMHAGFQAQVIVL